MKLFTAGTHPVTAEDTQLYTSGQITGTIYQSGQIAGTLHQSGQITGTHYQSGQITGTLYQSGKVAHERLLPTNAGIKDKKTFLVKASC